MLELEEVLKLIAKIRQNPEKLNDKLQVPSSGRTLKAGTQKSWDLSEIVPSIVCHTQTEAEGKFHIFLNCKSEFNQY